jgi:hypothetical protein
MSVFSVKFIYSLCLLVPLFFASSFEELCASSRAMSKRPRPSHVSPHDTDRFNVFDDANILKIHLFRSVPPGIERNAGEYHVAFELDHKHYYLGWKKSAIKSYQLGIDESTLSDHWGSKVVRSDATYHFPFLSFWVSTKDVYTVLPLKRSQFLGLRPYYSLYLELSEDVSKIKAIYEIFTEFIIRDEVSSHPSVWFDKLTETARSVTKTTTIHRTGEKDEHQLGWDKNLIDNFRVVVKNTGVLKEKGASSGAPAKINTDTVVEEKITEDFNSHFFVEKMIFDPWKRDYEKETDEQAFQNNKEFIFPLVESFAGIFELLTKHFNIPAPCYEMCFGPRKIGTVLIGISFYYYILESERFFNERKRYVSSKDRDLKKIKRYGQYSGCEGNLEDYLAFAKLYPGIVVPSLFSVLLFCGAVGFDLGLWKRLRPSWI